MKQNKQSFPSVSRHIMPFFVVFGIALMFAAVVFICFRQLLKPTSGLNARTLYQISNGYEMEDTLKGNLYDRNGVPLMGNVRLTREGVLERDENGLVLLSDVVDATEKKQKKVSYQRPLLDEEHQECWSNILPAAFGGLDYDFAGFLQDIPLESEEETNVTLTLDSVLQRETYDILANRKYASAYVMDCNNGDVLTMVSKPSTKYNDYRKVSMPYISMVLNGSFSGNVDNSRDCVQDYYKLWKKQYQDHQDTTPDAALSLAKWASEQSKMGMLMTRAEAQAQLDYWNGLYGHGLSLADCITVDFLEIYQEETAFYADSANKGKTYPFVHEPESIRPTGENRTYGRAYTPFVALKLPGDNGNAAEQKYLKLFYGSSNFIYEDCKAYEFDPNFSMQNYAVQPAEPGSSFKVLMSALLADSVQENLIANEKVNIFWKVREYAKPLPTIETVGMNTNLSTVQDGLNHSSNQYFAAAAMLLDDILQCADASYTCTMDRIDEICAEEGSETLKRSGAFMQHYYEKVFCLNADIPSYFHITKPKMISCLDNIDTSQSNMQEGQYYYSDLLWYDVDENHELTLAHTPNGKELAQLIGNTAYGQGFDLVSPAYMAMCIGKCLTGKMVVPNMLTEQSTTPQYIGEPFSREAQTVSIMKETLKGVYDAHSGNIPEGISFDSSNRNKKLSFYSKTGTSSKYKGSGTQSAYGTFAEAANYHVQSNENSQDQTDKYETIWYVAAVSDGTHTYSVVLRSFFDEYGGSSTLKQEFLGIVDLLCKQGYLDV